jgi:2,4-dienoyl-CoA reductase-like NADH-dependent reductase (Old Yellow Enzyme family)/thioredoxin reductase
MTKIEPLTAAPLPGVARYPHLFSPIMLGPVRLKNRIIHASMTTRHGKEGRATDRLIAYFANRAKGGAAAVVTEPLNCLPWQKTQPYKVRIVDDKEFDSLQRWAEAVERHDCRLIGQLQDPGRGTHHKGRRQGAVSSSPLYDDLSWTVPHALSTGEVEGMVETLVDGARRLQRAGFSGVELSCGHGHIFHQFLSPAMNIREDRYGGSRENRLRLVSELVNGIHQACGSGFLIGLKLPGDDGMEGGIDEAESAIVTQMLCDPAKVHYVTHCQGAHHRSLENHIPDMHWPRMPFVAQTRRLKEHTNGVPIAALGKILEPLMAEDILAEGSAELVQLGRTLITDPAWPLKAMQHREPEIRLCVSCNTCWGQLNEKNSLACDNNPKVADDDEVDFLPAPAPVKKKVIIVGAGCAGLEAAWVAGHRGHDVTVYGASTEYGGKARLQSFLPGSDQVTSVYDYQIVMATRAGVKLELGRRVSAEEIIAQKPDAVILATGSRMRWPRALPPEWQEEGIIPDLRDVTAMLLEGYPRQPGTAVIYDQDHTNGTYAAAQLMHGIFDRVVIVTPRAEIAHDEPLVEQQGIYRRMSELDIELVTMHEPTGEGDLAEGILRVRHVLSRKPRDITDVALFTYATPRLPNDELERPLREAGIDVRLVGDAHTPALLLAATASGHAAGMAV